MVFKSLSTLFLFLSILTVGCTVDDNGNRSLAALSGAWGNAEGITGEEVGAKFYRLDPQFSCAGTPAAYRDALVPGATSFTQEGSACGEPGSNSIPLSDVETSFYNPRLAGYQAGIYEYLVEVPNNSESYIVNWCRDVSANAIDGTDIVVRSEQGRLSAAIYRGSSAHPNEVFKVAPFPVSRDAGSNAISYRSSNYAFRLDSGRVEVKIGDQTEVFEVRCR